MAFSTSVASAHVDMGPSSMETLRPPIQWASIRRKTPRPAMVYATASSTETTRPPAVARRPSEKVRRRGPRRAARRKTEGTSAKPAPPVMHAMLPAVTGDQKHHPARPPINVKKVTTEIAIAPPVVVDVRALTTTGVASWLGGSLRRRCARSEPSATADAGRRGAPEPGTASSRPMSLA